MTACTWISASGPTRRTVRARWSAATWAASGDEDVLEASDEELVDACARHLAAVLDLPERPESSSVVRWMRAMPQYEVGHVDRVAAIRRALPAGIFVVGTAYDGVGVPDCVRAAGETAEQVLAHLDRATIEKETAR